MSKKTVSMGGNGVGPECRPIALIEGKENWLIVGTFEKRKLT